MYKEINSDFLLFTGVICSRCLAYLRMSSPKCAYNSSQMPSLIWLLDTTKKSFRSCSWTNQVHIVCDRNSLRMRKCTRRERAGDVAIEFVPADNFDIVTGHCWWAIQNQSKYTVLVYMVAALCQQADHRASPMAYQLLGWHVQRSCIHCTRHQCPRKCKGQNTKEPIQGS